MVGWLALGDRPTLPPEGHQVLGVKVDVHLLLLLEEVVEDVRVVPDLAADSEGLQRVGHTPETSDGYKPG